MAEEKEKKEKKVKVPTAQKRDIQNEKRRRRNKSFRSTITSAVRTLQTSISEKEAPDALKLKLNTVYSLLDKGVKRGIFKLNKASRTKARLSARCKI